MGIIEIVLTVFAWRKGWHGFALVPGAVGVAVAFLLVAMGAPESTLYVCDIVMIGVLGAMIAQVSRATGPSAQN